MRREPTERLRKIDRIFQGALEIPPAERSGYLVQACGSDLNLQHRVRCLLLADARAETFLERPLGHSMGRPAGRWQPTRSRDTRIRDTRNRETLSWQTTSRRQTATGTWRVHPPRSPHGRSTRQEERTIGPYRLHRRIGRGGMSTVFLATHFREASHRVALKILHRGLDDAEMLRRFRRERLLLSRLRHPHIAQLRGGGTAQDGRPYLVMEYVEGWPIDEYCDRRRLDISARLELFRRVSMAVQYAHRHHLVHRDLKPDNILVTADGTPKLLDFGIAKLLDRAFIDMTLETTLAGVRLMTPGYASPEQILGKRVTPASDIYSLGVLLYRLLSGRGPYRAADDVPHRLGSAICRHAPLPPSEAVFLDEENEERCRTPERLSRARGTSPRRLRRRLSGDLDAIVLRSLDKLPAKRYGSAAELAGDILCHLKHRPVRARRATVLYRLGKLARRHRNALAVGAAVAGVLLAWLGFP